MCKTLKSLSLLPYANFVTWFMGYFSFFGRSVFALGHGAFKAEGIAIFGCCFSELLFFW